MNKRQTIQSSYLGIDESGGTCWLTCGVDRLTTAGGHEVSHTGRRLIEHMITELDECGELTIEDRVIVEPQSLSSYALYSIQKDWVERGKDDLTLDFAGRITCDGTLFRCAGPDEAMEQFARWGPVISYLNDLETQLPNLAGPFIDDPEFYGSAEVYDEAKELATPDSEFVAKVRADFEELAPAQKAAVMMLHAIHQGVVLFPLILVLGRCTPGEYASGVIASHASISGVFPDADSDSHRRMFTGLRDDARTAIEFLECCGLYDKHEEIDELRREIAIGETKTQEFKSTLRWNIKAQRNDDAMTHSCLKTIAAFLNSDGGNLFIGVDDEGAIGGIEPDGFPNNDKFMLHLNNVIQQSMGQTAATYVNPQTHELDGKTICRVACEKNTSDNPIFVKFKKGDEEFFVRTGPSTTKLPPSQIVEFLKRRKS